MIDQLRSSKTFDEAEQIARRRFEQILCLNLNKTSVDVPQECKLDLFPIVPRYDVVTFSFRVLLLSFCTPNLNRQESAVVQ